MKILYFAWIRERIGIGHEVVDLPADIDTVDDFLSWMRSRGDEFSYALQSKETVRVALDQVHCNDLSTTLKNVKEIALFPPMTGG